MLPFSGYPTMTLPSQGRSDGKPITPAVDTGAKTVTAAVSDKHDWVKYTMTNAPVIGLAGLVTGLQEAYYTFEKLPSSVTRNNLLQAKIVFAPVLQKTALATALGAVFCGSDALIEGYRGKHDMTSGIVAGAITGALFGITRPAPQPVAWPLAFAAAAAAADIVGEYMPMFFTSAQFKFWGAVPGRENWNDPEPPRPPIMATGASIRPTDGGHFWRGS